MQTTLLGLAIAFIIALIAALVGPYFIDWNQFRPQFEAEATRIIGAPVRIGGTLDARLLPAPSKRGARASKFRMPSRSAANARWPGSILRWRRVPLPSGPCPEETRNG